MEKKLPISKNKKFIYSITYQHTDEESSELGEFKEIGFEVEKSTDTIGKILKLANENYNIYYPISVGNWESTSPVEDRDYWEKGIHKFYVLHINNEDGTSISEEENNFITYLLSNGQYNSEEFEEFYLGGLIIGGLIGGYIGYYYGKNPRKKYDFGGEVVGNEVTYNYYGEEQKGNILEVLDDTALVVQTGTNKRLVDGSDVIKIHYNNSFDAGGKIQEEITYLENRIYNLEQLRDVAGEDEIEYYDKIIKDLEEEKSKLMSGEVEEEPKKKKFFFFADGGKTDEFDFDEKMALINLDMCYEYSVKLDKMVSEDTQLEDWVKMKLTIVEQNIADVKHALEGWEKFGEGGMIFKKQLLHIAKYSKELIEMIQKGSRLMSWQENKLAVSSAMIDAIYHHLDYEFGNRASKLKKEKYAKGGGVGEVTQVYGKYLNNNTDDPYMFSSNSKGLDFLTNHKNIELLSIGQGKYDLFYGWDNNKQEDGQLYFGKWNKGNFGFKYQGSIKYAKGGGVEEITPELNRRVKERAEEIYHNNKGKTKKDFANAFNNAIQEFGYSPQIYHQTMREIGAEYDEFAKGGGVEENNGRYQIKGASHYASKLDDVLYYSTNNKNEIGKLVKRALKDWENTRFGKSRSVTHIYVYDVINDENIYQYAEGGWVNVSPFHPMDRYNKIRHFMLSLGFEVDDIQPPDNSVGLSNGLVTFNKTNDKTKALYEIDYDDLMYHIHHNGSREDIFKDSFLVDEDEYADGGGVGKYYNGMSKEEILSKTIVYDNQGETLDRYTIFTPDGSVFGMSENASGFNQYIGDETEIEKGKHLGKKLTSVPKDIEWAVLDRMIEEYADGGFMEEVVTKPKVAPTPVTTPKPNTDNPYKPKTKTPPKAKYDFLLLNK